MFGRHSLAVIRAMLLHVLLVEIEDVDDDGYDSSHQESEEDCETSENGSAVVTTPSIQKCDPLTDPIQFCLR